MKKSHLPNLTLQSYKQHPAAVEKWKILCLCETTFAHIYLHTLIYFLHIVGLAIICRSRNDNINNCCTHYVTPWGIREERWGRGNRQSTIRTTYASICKKVFSFFITHKKKSRVRKIERNEACSYHIIEHSFIYMYIRKILSTDNFPPSSSIHIRLPSAIFWMQF